MAQMVRLRVQVCLFYIMNTAPPPSFEIGGKLIKNVDQWPHLSHIFDAHLTDDDDILTHRNSFIGQQNSFLCNFSVLDPQTKNMLFKQYCSSHYGCILWDLTNSDLEDYCIAWRKGVRKIWSLPHDSSPPNVSLISDSLQFTLNIHPCLIRWMHSFWLNRQQRVKIASTFSTWTTLTGGMPQGTWFGPYVFLILIDDLHTIIDTFKFVDDVTLTEVVVKQPADSRMQLAINQLAE
jgi:hypothetical protein